MNNVQTSMAELQKKGWTVAALADELGQALSTVEKWKSGERYPANAKAILNLLDKIGKHKRIPKKRRYSKGSRKKYI